MEKDGKSIFVEVKFVIS